MTDLELLFLVLAGIYLFECACWIPRGSVAYLSWLGLTTAPRFNPLKLLNRLGLLGWRIAHPAILFGNQRGGFVFASPIPPLGKILVAHQFPVSLSPSHALAYVATSINPGARPVQSAVLLKYEEIKTGVIDGKKLLINDRLFFKGSSAKEASDLKRLLSELVKASPEQREKQIRKLIKESLETKTIEKRWDEFLERTDFLNLLTNLLFFYLFVLAPVYIYRFSLERTWPALLIGLYGLTTTTAIIFRRIHKHYYPESGDDRFMHFLTILFSPATTIRARDVLSRPLLSGFHPLAVASVFSREEDLRDLAGRVLRDIRTPALPICPNSEAAVESTEKFFRALLQHEIEQFLRSKKVNIEQLLAPPLRTDETCKAFCPRCLAQFTSTDARCADCGGLPLLPLPNPRA